MAGLFAGLSISSLASDHGDDIIHKDDSFAWDQEDLSQSFEMINSVLRQQYAAAVPQRESEGDVYATSIDKIAYLNVECGSTGTSVSLSVPSTASDSVLTIAITCLPVFVAEEEHILCARRKRHPTTDFSALRFNLFHKKSGVNVASMQTSVPVRTQLFNGMYLLMLTTATGLRPGSYLLNITSDGDDGSDDDLLPYDQERQSSSRNQGISLKWSLGPTVHASAISASKPVKGFVGGNEYAYYRFVLTDPRHMLTVKVNPLVTDEHAQNAEVELYISNLGDGLVPSTRESHVWSSTELFPCVEILPDDPHFFNAGLFPNDVRHFVIGVVGVQDANHFELEVVVGLPPPVTVLSALGQPAFQAHTAPIALGEPSHFTIAVNPVQSQMVALHWSVATQGQSAEGRRFQTMAQFIAHFQLSCDSSDGVFVSENLPPFCGETVSAPPLWQLEVIIYISATTRYPSPTNYTWKAFGQLEAAFVLDCVSWKYLSSECHVSVYVHQARDIRSSHLLDDFALDGVNPSSLLLGYCAETEEPASTDTHLKTDNLHLCYSAWVVKKDSYSIMGAAPNEWSLRQEFFLEIFSHVTPFALSHKDRDAWQSSSSGRMLLIDEQSLAYGEVSNVFDFSMFLHQCGAINGQIFYDLGAGCGKALIAATLSGISFLKCCGIEVLPSLAETGSSIIACFTDQHQDAFAGDVGQSVLSASAINGSNSAEAELSWRERAGGYTIVPILEFRNENFLESEWSDGDIVFVTSTCFSDRILEEMFALAERLHRGAKLITSRLPNSGLNTAVWTLEQTVRCEMSWGSTEFLVLLRR